MNRRSSRVATVVAAMALVALLAGPAAALTQEPVKTNPDVDERYPAATDGFLAWSQRGSGPWVSYIQPDGGSRRRISATNTDSFVGGFSEDGSTLAFQQVSEGGSGNSNIKLWDVAAEAAKNPPAGVNTTAWEWAPSVSDTHLLFGRIRRAPNPDVWEIFLKDLGTGDLVEVASVAGNDVYLEPAQVVGDWVVYYRYTPASPGHVWRYRISTGDVVKVPKTDTWNYAPSVAPDGDVYFVQSGQGCGTSVELMRWDGPGTTAVELVDFAANRDVYDTYTHTDEAGDRHVYYDRGGCGSAAQQDVYRVTDPAPGA